MIIKNWPLEWGLITYEWLENSFLGLLNFIPKLLGALIVFSFGWLFASGIGRLVTEILNKLKFNQFFEKTGWAEAFRRADLKVNLSEFFGAVVKWILIFTFLLAVVDILEFKYFALFLTGILGFLPNIIAVVLVFVVAIILADIVQKLTVASIEKAGLAYSRALGLLVRFSILGFAILIILVQLGVATEIFVTLFQGIVAFFVVSFGLAFGLGGRDVAADILRALKEKLK